MGNIAQGFGQEANIARGETKCYICLETTLICNFSLENIVLPHYVIIKHSSALSSCMASYN